MNILTANTSREKEVFIGALHNRATRLKTIKILNDRRLRSDTSFIRLKSILLTICNNGNFLGCLLLLMQRKAKFGLY
jgi:hypothetical protein